MASKAVGTKRRRKETVNKYEQDYTYTYESHKAAPHVLHKTKGFDSLTGTTQEKRGRKKADSTGKVKEHTRTEKQKVTGNRSRKQSKAKKGGK